MSKFAEDGAGQWRPFGATDVDFDDPPERNGVHVVNVAPTAGQGKDTARIWLRVAVFTLTLLASAAAAVSWQAQYSMVQAIKHYKWVAALEAGIPDAGAIVFAALGIALALHGKRALRPRILNIMCVGISLMQNALASGAGWRDLAIWVMPSAVYAVASDTLIGVIRSWAMARVRNLGEALADEGLSLADMVGGSFLWGLRLTLAPKSTLGGFRSWVVTDCPVAPGLRPGHVAQLEAVRQEAGQLAELVTAERDMVIERAKLEISQAQEESVRAEAAEAAMREELQNARSGAIQERKELNERMQRQAEELRAELGQIRNSAEERIEQLLADATREREELRTQMSEETEWLRAELDQVQAQKSDAVADALKETRAELQDVSGRLADALEEIPRLRADATREREELRTQMSQETERLRAELDQVQAQKSDAVADALKETRAELQDVSGRLADALKEIPRLRAAGQDRSRSRRARVEEKTKRDRMIELAGDRRDLQTIPLKEVSKLASAVASEIGYSSGTARRELMNHVRKLQGDAAALVADGEEGESE